MNKPFSPTLYAQNDDAKLLVIDYLKANGFLAKVNPDQYGIDLLARNIQTSQNYELEVEVKHNWKGPRFQFSTLHFPGRKLKFVKDSKTTVFFILNHERTHAYWVDGTVLSKSPVVTKDTIYTKNEQFIEVSLGGCKVIDLSEPLDIS
jgi:hypothetical protein